MSDTLRMPNPSPYSFGTLTFVFGLVLGALIGGLYLSGRSGGEDAALAPTSGDIAALKTELQERAAEIAGLHESLQAADRELQHIVESMTIAGPSEVEAALQVADARQLEIDSLATELADARNELDRLQSDAADHGVTAQYIFVLETMHRFAEGGYIDGVMYGDDPALGDALSEIGDAALSDAVLMGLLESDPAATALFYTALQQVLNHLQDRVVG